MTCRKRILLGVNDLSLDKRTTSKATVSSVRKTVRIGIVIVGAVMMVVGIVLIPTSRHVSEASDAWVRVDGGDASSASFGVAYFHLYAGQRWALKITHYNGTSSAQGTLTVPSNLMVRLYDDNGHNFEVPYSVLEGMPHGWGPVTVEGYYAVRLVGLREALGFRAEFDVWGKEAQTIYYNPLRFQIGLALLIGGAIITLLVTVLRRR